MGRNVDIDDVEEIIEEFDNYLDRKIKREPKYLRGVLHDVKARLQNKVMCKIWDLESPQEKNEE